MVISFCFLLSACSREKLSCQAYEDDINVPKLKYDSTNRFIGRKDCKQIQFDYISNYQLYAEVATRDLPDMSFEPVCIYKSDTLILSYKTSKKYVIGPSCSCIPAYVLSYTINTGDKKIDKVFFVKPDDMKECVLCNNAALNNIHVNIPVRKTKIFDYTKLWGRWVFITGRNSGDSNLASFMPDTDQSKSKHGYFRVEDFDSAHQWHIRNDDVGYDGTYKIDSLTNEIRIYSGYPKQLLDTTYMPRIIYLDKNYLLTTYVYRHKKYVEFFMNRKARSNWNFAKGG